MKVIGFAASPRRGGNSETLLDEVIKGLRAGGVEVDKIRTHELSFSPCINCGRCNVLGRCVIEDSFQELFQRLIECDGVVFASPLYFMNVPAGGKSLIDRCQVFWTAKYHLKLDLFGGRHRFGLLVACSGAGFGPGKAPIFRGIEDTMTFVFKALGMEILPSLLFSRIDGKGAIFNVPSALEKAFETGKNMAELMLRQ
jgi:multimeric flavodoxin WrbA